MMGTPQNERPDCFWQARFDEPVAELVRVIREVRPQVVVTYDDNGGYGHPDHIQAHRVTVAAFERAGDPSYGEGEPWAPDKLYWTAIARSFLQRGIDLLKESGQENFFGVDSAEELPFGVPDDQITTEVDATDHLDHKIAAMRAHATQIEVDGPFFALSNNLGQRAWGVEHYVLARGRSPQSRETDLFDGI
jgi:N-acetyl-1-D-myo-inositol-2-amino-2-deoxy-alpha-D-glucopyranoside deacetylase